MEYIDIISSVNKYKLLVHLGITIIVFSQCIFTSIEKRIKKNFIAENSFLSSLLKGLGLYILMFEGIMLMHPFEPIKVLIILGALLSLISWIIYHFKSRDYSIYNISDNELDLITKDILKKHKIKFNKNENFEYEIDNKDFKNSLIKINTRGVFRQWCEIQIKRHRYIHNLEEVIEDLREIVLKRAKINKYRGLEELLISIVLVLVMYNMAKYI